VKTDRTVPNNKADIIIHINDEGTCLLRDITISGDRNVIKEKAENILKYKDLTVETQYMWSVQVEIKMIPVITGTTGTISKSPRMRYSKPHHSCESH